VKQYTIKTKHYSSIEHNHIFYSVMTYMFALNRPSSGHHYKNFKIRYSTMQIMLVIWDPIWLMYKSYTIPNYIKIIGLVMSWLVIVSKLCVETSNIGRKIVKMKLRFLCLRIIW